jgi:hypothetical protein
MNLTVLKVNGIGNMVSIENLKSVIGDAMKRSNKGSLVWDTYNEVIIMLKVISEQYDKESYEELDPDDLNAMLKNMKLDDFSKN